MDVVFGSEEVWRLDHFMRKDKRDPATSIPFDS